MDAGQLLMLILFVFTTPEDRQLSNAYYICLDGSKNAHHSMVAHFGFIKVVYQLDKAGKWQHSSLLMCSTLSTPVLFIGTSDYNGILKS